MIDLHTHILPKIDDGSTSIEESIAMMREAKVQGFEALVLTPHYMLYTDYQSDWETNENQLKILKERAKAEKIDLYLFLGNEVYYDPEIISQIGEKKFTTINKSHYYLVETMRKNSNPIHWETFLFQLQGKGYTPIIAHPERYDFVQENPNVLRELIKHGSLVQMNILSLVGAYGETAKATAEVLLTHGMVHFLSTDAHQVKAYEKFHRAKEIAIALVGEEIFDKLIDENPKRVLVDLPISINQPEKVKLRNRKKGFKNPWRK
ncbi:MAG: tyrosine-protein phosphatase [Eubacteriaceae bacterium]